MRECASKPGRHTCASWSDPAASAAPTCAARVHVNAPNDQGYDLRAVKVFYRKG